MDEDLGILQDGGALRRVDDPQDGGSLRREDIPQNENSLEWVNVPQDGGPLGQVDLGRNTNKFHVCAVSLWPGSPRAPRAAPQDPRASSQHPNCAQPPLAAPTSLCPSPASRVIPAQLRGRHRKSRGKRGLTACHRFPNFHPKKAVPLVWNQNKHVGISSPQGAPRGERGELLPCPHLQLLFDIFHL